MIEKRPLHGFIRSWSSFSCVIIVIYAYIEKGELWLEGYSESILGHFWRYMLYVVLGTLRWEMGRRGGLLGKYGLSECIICRWYI